jgi:TPP-dependent pyruvate/acetoin dehydrogenase alpha subunit
MDLENIRETSDTLIKFEEDLARICLSGGINGPVHFAQGNERQLIKIFRGLRRGDYVEQSDSLSRRKVLEDGLVVVPSASGKEPYFQGIMPKDSIFVSYRNHPHLLLKGLPAEEVKQNVIEGRSMYPMSREYGVFSSAIVPGHVPPALGLALAYNRSGSDKRVWAFCGDMAAQTGVFHEASNYAANFDLPITFVIEDNGMSVDTPTRATWAMNEDRIQRLLPNTIFYAYTNGFKHQGAQRGVGAEVGF